MTTKVKVPIRAANAAEISSMNPTVLWAYDNGLPVVLWPLDGVITVLPTNKKPQQLQSGIILQRGAW